MDAIGSDNQVAISDALKRPDGQKDLNKVTFRLKVQVSLEEICGMFGDMLYVRMRACHC